MIRDGWAVKSSKPDGSRDIIAVFKREVDAMRFAALDWFHTPLGAPERWTVHEITDGLLIEFTQPAGEAA